MSYSCDKIINSISKHSHLKQKEGKSAYPYNYKRYSPNNNRINNMKLIPNQETSSSGTSNITSFKEKEKYEIPYFSFPVKSLEEFDVENYFMKKNKKIFESPTVLSDKKISFQRQKDKKIMEFVLFDDKIIFKDINRSYLQDEESDDGDESSDEKIKLGQNLLIQELEESSKEIKENLKNNKENSLLSRKIRFKKDYSNK
jgi:hypothetical protein